MGAPTDGGGRSSSHRLRDLWRRIEWPIIWGLALLALVLGVIGFSRHAELHDESWSFLDVFYRSLQLFILESGSVQTPVPLTLEIARLLAPFVGIYTASKALLVLFADQLRAMRIARLRDHVIIAGGGRIGLALARALRERTDVVVIDRRMETECATTCQRYGALALEGDATEPAVLRRAGLLHADRLIAVTGDDGTNAQIAVLAREEVVGSRDRKDPLTCLIHVFELELFRLLATPWLAGTGNADFRIEFLNVFDRGARSMLERHPPFSDGEATPRILVAGLGRFGESLVLQAARRWRTAAGAGPLPILVVDREATSRCETLALRYPELAAWATLEPHDLDVHSPAFERGDFLFDAAGHPAVTTVYVCFDDDLRSLAAALALHGRLEHADVPVIARMEHDAGLAALPRAASAAGVGFDGLHAFGLRDQTWTPELVFEGSLEALARALHERYLADRRAAGDVMGARDSMVEWKELREDLRESNRRQALGIRSLLSAAGFALVPQRGWQGERTAFDEDEVERLAELEHDRWVEERIAAGWRYSDVRNDERRLHPNLVAWNSARLPDEIREIDRNVVRALPALVAGTGYAIVQQQPARPVAEGGTG